MLHLHYIHPSKFDVIKTTVANRFLLWNKNWSLAENSVVVNVLRVLPADINNEDYKTYTEKQDGVVFFIEDLFFDWKKAIFFDAINGTIFSAQCTDVICAAKDDLYKTLFSESVTNRKAAPSVPKHIKTYVLITISVEKAGIIKFIFPDYCLAYFFPENKKLIRKPFFSKRIDAVNNKYCQLNVTLDFGFFSVDEISNFAVGTILHSEQIIENKFVLESNKSVLASVALGKLENEKAFMVLNGEKN